MNARASSICAATLGVILLWTGGAGAQQRGPVLNKRGLFRGALSAMSGHSDPVWQGATSIRPLPGYYDFVVHGNTHKLGLKVKGRNDTELRTVLISPKEAVKFLRATGYASGPLRLIACNVGEVPDGPAQDIANLIRAEVLAPNSEVLVGGGMSLDRDKQGQPGQWKKFFPQPGVTDQNPINVPFRASRISSPSAAPPAAPAAPAAPQPGRTPHWYTFFRR